MGAGAVSLLAISRLGRKAKSWLTNKRPKRDSPQWSNRSQKSIKLGKWKLLSSVALKLFLWRKFAISDCFAESSDRVLQQMQCKTFSMETHGILKEFKNCELFNSCLTETKPNLYFFLS